MPVALAPAILKEAETWTRGLPPSCLPSWRAVFEAVVISVLALRGLFSFGLAYPCKCS
jgi:hypothetical protein